MQYFTDTDMGLDIGLVNLAVESAFADHGKGLVQMPPKVYVTLPEGDFRTMPAYLPSLSIAGRENCQCPSRKSGKGTANGDGTYSNSGYPNRVPVAIINATKLTDMRTGAAVCRCLQIPVTEKRSCPRGCRHGEAGGGTGRSDLPGNSKYGRSRSGGAVRNMSGNLPTGSWSSPALEVL